MGRADRNVTVELSSGTKLVVTPAKRLGLEVVAGCDGHARCATATTPNTIAWRTADWLREHGLADEYHKTPEQVGPRGDTSGWYRVTALGRLVLTKLAES